MSEEYFTDEERRLLEMMRLMSRTAAQMERDFSDNDEPKKALAAYRIRTYVDQEIQTMENDDE